MKETGEVVAVPAALLDPVVSVGHKGAQKLNCKEGTEVALWLFTFFQASKQAKKNGQSCLSQLVIRSKWCWSG